jgi:hypothetical protein
MAKNVAGVAAKSGGIMAVVAHQRNGGSGG